LRFFLDNNLAPKLARGFHQFVLGEHEVVHLRDRFSQETPNVEWMQQLADESGWVILSGVLSESRLDEHRILATGPETRPVLSEHYRLRPRIKARRILHRYRKRKDQLVFKIIRDWGSPLLSLPAVASNVAARLNAKPMSVALATVFAASFDIRHSTFTAHSAHSRNIISGTPESESSEWDERDRR
jgi:PIN domain-containing protein